jgi:hypothetical protein
MGWRERAVYSVIGIGLLLVAVAALVSPAVTLHSDPWV